MSNNRIKNIKEIRAYGAAYIKNQDTKAYINQIINLYETGKINNIRTCLNLTQKLGTAGKSKAIATIESYNKPLTKKDILGLEGDEVRVFYDKNKILNQSSKKHYTVMT